MTGRNGQPYLYGVVEKIETAAVGVLELRAPPKHSFVEAGLLYLFQSRERIYLEKAAPEILSLCNFCQRHFKPASKLAQKYAITDKNTFVPFRKIKYTPLGVQKSIPKRLNEKEVELFIYLKVN